MKESVYKSFVSGDPHEEELLRQLIRGDIAGYEVLSVSYTHLTLPTYSIV